MESPISDSTKMKMSSMAAATREPTPASSNCTSTCSGVSTPCSCRRSRSRAEGVTSSSYRHPGYRGRRVMADLKPMDIGEILDGALTIFRRHFMLFIKIGIIALWFPVALTIYLELAGGTQEHWVLALLVSIIRYFAGLFLTASAIRIISDSYLGRQPELSDALALGGSKIMPMFFVGFGKAVLLGLTGAIIAGIAAVGMPRAIASGGGGAALAVLAVVLVGCWAVLYLA